MYLEREQERALEGELGPAWQWAIEELANLGHRVGAARLVPVSGAHIADWRGRVLPGPLREVEGHGPRFAVTTTVNPGGPLDSGSHRTAPALTAWGLRGGMTCTPHLVGNHPGRRELVAWAGRAASAFANSVLGARGEVETYSSSLASAITGLTPERGLLVERNRRATVAVVVPRTDAPDHAALGWGLSGMVRGEVPLLCGVSPNFDQAKRMVLSINAAGTTPLARWQRDPAPPPGLERMELEKSAWYGDNASGEGVDPDLAVIGCPHLSEQEINWWSRRLSIHRASKMEAWFFTSDLCSDKCPYSVMAMSARGRVFYGTCPLAVADQMKARSVVCQSPSLASCLSTGGVKASYLPAGELLRILNA